MKILIAGGTGFVGQHLISSLKKDNPHCSITILSRSKNLRNKSNYVFWEDSCLQQIVNENDVIVNLCGESIMECRWSRKQKQKLEDSRIKKTRQLVNMVNLNSKPQTFIQASAIGFYGTETDSFIDESSPVGKDYLAKLCQKWENELQSLHHQNRYCIVRMGIVLGYDGGAFPKLVLPISLGTRRLFG